MVNEALALLADDKRREGTECLRRATDVDPDCAEAWGHLSWQLTMAGRHDQALHCLDHVLRLHPENNEARWRHADRLVRLGRLDEAEREYRAVLDADPDCHDARTGLRWIEWRRREQQKPSRSELQETMRDIQASPPTDRRQQAAENERRAWRHFERGDRRLTSLPSTIEIETTSRCNAACITCLKGYGPYYAEDLRPEVFERIERDLLPAALHINLTGYGEPLIARSFDRLLEEMGRTGAHVYLVTNGTALTMARLERLARRHTDVVVSIDGATAGTFESIRPPTRFDRVVESLRLFKKARDLYPEVGSALGFNFVAMRRNIEDLPAVVDLAADVGAAFIEVLDFETGHVPPAIAAEHLSRFPELANAMFDEAAERARRRGVRLDLPPKFPAISPPQSGRSSPSRLRRLWPLFSGRSRFPQQCADPWTKALISTAGLVHPCCVSRRAMGDLTRDGFAAIWNGRRYRRFRRRIRTFLPPPECRQCNQLWGINAGNPSAVRTGEGLVVKVLYRLEARWLRLVEAVRRRFSRSAPPPEPNYCQGRPIRRQQ